MRAFINALLSGVLLFAPTSSALQESKIEPQGGNTGPEKAATPGIVLPASYNQTLAWYESSIEMARAARKDCPKPPPIPPFMPTPPGGSDASLDAVAERWQSDIAAVRRRHNCPKPVPPVPPFYANPERLRVEWEQFRVSLEGFRKAVTANAADEQEASQTYKLYDQGLEIYISGIDAYQDLVANRKLPKGDAQ